eukprot:gene28048-36933_t
MGYISAFLVSTIQVSKWERRSERKIRTFVSGSENALTFFNGTMQRLQSHIALSNGGLNDINTIIMQSVVYLDEKLPHISTECYPTLEDLASSKQVQMVNERNEYVFAFYLTFLDSIPGDRYEKFLGPISNTAKSLGLTVGFKEGKNFIIDLGDISPFDFRLLIIQCSRSHLKRQYRELDGSPLSREVAPYYESCLRSTYDLEREIIASIGTVMQ